MKALIQRVRGGAVSVAGQAAARIGPGLVVFLGVRAGDSGTDAEHLARKTAALRIFADAQDRMNRSVQDVGGEILVVSQFTLYADTRRGNRPSFTAAAPPEQGEALYETYVSALRDAGVPVATGVFGAHMEVELLNDGPVTILLEA